MSCRELDRENAYKPEVTIVASKCLKSGKLFGIRFEKKEDTWSATWAFPLKEESAKREGYTETDIRGQFDFDEKYPGCPYCENTQLVKCTCNKVSCYNGNDKQIKCPWCKITGVVEGTVDSLSARGDY